MIMPSGYVAGSGPMMYGAPQAMQGGYTTYLPYVYAQDPFTYIGAIVPPQVMIVMQQAPPGPTEVTSPGLEQERKSVTEKEREVATRRE
jgi:hypothetical protein